MNLLVCCTPFQIIVASEIIKKYPGEKFYLLLLCLDHNNKYEYYFNKYKVNFEKSKVIVLFHKKIKLLYLFSLFYIKLFILISPKFKTIFMANIDLLELQIMMSNNMNIVTFDDGVANVISSSSLYIEKLSLKRRILDKLFFNQFTAKKIREKISVHYSIYKGIKNISENVIYLPLFFSGSLNTEYSKLNQTNGITSIFLGQPLDFNENNMLSILRKFEINYYFPHPREYTTYNNVEYINTELIFEDFILYLLSKNKDRIYKIYTFTSGAILNIMNFPNVQVYPIYLDHNNSAFEEVYGIFKRFNLDMIYIDRYEN